MSSLTEIFESHEGRLLHKWNHYLEIYERYFAKYKGTPVNILEIGISHGGSLQMWRKYFGEQANIYAVDINPQCKQFEEGKTKVFIGSQEDPIFLENLKAQLPALDILLDDGGHTMSQQIVTFKHLFDKVKDDGLYMIEDTHTSYWREYHGGYKNRHSFIEFSKNIIDQIHAWNIDNEKIAPIDEITRHTNSIAFYDSIVVIEKTLREEPVHSMRGEPTIITQVDKTLKKDSLWQRIKKKIAPKKGKFSYWRQLKK
jgi:hypothetical protein